MAAQTKTTAIREPFTKARLFAEISEETGLAKKDIAAVYESLTSVIHRHLKKRAAGSFTLPGLAKFTVVSKKATKAQTKPNPFKPGEMMTVAAKPARRLVKIRALKGLKEMADS